MTMETNNPLILQAQIRMLRRVLRVVAAMLKGREAAHMVVDPRHNYGLTLRKFILRALEDSK